MRKLIPQKIRDEFKILFLPVPAIEERHLTQIDFSSLPTFTLMNPSIRKDYVRPVAFIEHSESALLITDKLNNHSLYSLMAVQSGKTPKKGFQELTDFEIRSLFETVRCFFEGYAASNFIPRFSYNHDPHTSERPGLQSIERFHAHFYLLRREDLALGRAVLLRDVLYSQDYKDYFDPAAESLEQILQDIHRKWIKAPSGFELIEERLIDKVRSGRGLGLNILYNGSAAAFASPQFLRYLRSLHRWAEQVFSRVAKTRSRLPWFSEETKRSLKDLFDSLEELPPRIKAQLGKKQKLAKNLLAYASLSYSFSIDLLSPGLYLLNIYPRLFSEIGGAGIFAASGFNAVVIERTKASYFTPQKVEERRSFQQEFLQRLRKL